VVNGQTVITYNEFAPGFLNGLIFTGSTNAFADELSQVPGLQWASFDGSTNLPVLYPGGDITNLLNQLLVHVSPEPPDLPAGETDTAYGPVTFTASGGPFNAPFTWTAANLPAGLSMSPDGILSGTPTQFGTFDVTVTLTDRYGRSVSWNYTLHIF